VVGVTADASVEPVSHIDSAVGADGNIRRAEVGDEVVGHLAAHRVHARKVLIGIRREELHAVEGESSADGLGLVAKNDIAGGFAAQEESAPFFAQRAVFVVDDSGGGAGTVDVTRRNRAGVILTPFGGRDVLAGAAIGGPTAGAITREETEVAVFLEVSRAGRGRIVVIVLEDVAERGDGLLVAVTEP